MCLCVTERRLIVAFIGRIVSLFQAASAPPLARCRPALFPPPLSLSLSLSLSFFLSFSLRVSVFATVFGVVM